MINTKDFPVTHSTILTTLSYSDTEENDLQSFDRAIDSIIFSVEENRGMEEEALDVFEIFEEENVEPTVAAKNVEENTSPTCFTKSILKQPLKMSTYESSKAKLLTFHPDTIEAEKSRISQSRSLPLRKAPSLVSQSPSNIDEQNEQESLTSYIGEAAGVSMNREKRLSMFAEWHKA